jgi:predicted HD phosphohydrolase
MAVPMATSVSQLLTTLAQARGQSDGEAVDLLEHGLQCAAILAQQEPADVELHAAGLVHDIGTVLFPNRPKTHARSGATYVEAVLGPRVAWLVAYHDEAKRFLVTLDPDYREQLSRRSIETLEAQGGLLTARECTQLRGAPWIDELLMLRRADDHAKVPNRAVSDLAAWLPTLEHVARSQSLPA